MIVIRKATPRDFSAIYALDKVAWSDNDFPDFIPDGEHVWRIWCEHAIVYLAVENERVVGTILAFLCENGTYCLHKVFVDHAYRNQNIGTKLFEDILAVTDKKGKTTFLTVDPANPAAIALYEKWGYMKGEVVKGYYRAHEDRYVMVRGPQSE